MRQITIKTISNHEGILEKLVADLLIENYFMEINPKAKFPCELSIISEKITSEELKKTLTSEKLPSNEFEIITFDQDETDWLTEWKKYFQQFEVGKNILVLPAWEDVPSTDKLVIKVDPGMAFGTGSHATTYLCLELLSELIKPDMQVLDFGAGSAILAVAAVKLGAKRCDAVEIDPEAVKYAQKNVDLNECGNQINLYTGSTEQIPLKNYDLIVANITADVLIELYDQIIKDQQNLKYLILSGISEFRKTQMDNFLFSKEIIPWEIRFMNGWYTYLLKPTI